MGGFDVFFSSIQDDNSWSVPSNCGYPINSTEDDVFYIISVDGKRAYYSSHQYGGIGEKDLYIVNIPGSQIEPLTVMKGIVALSDGKEPDGVKITVKDIDKDKVIGTYTPNSKTGKFLFILAPEKTYNIYCEAENYMYYAENLTVPNETAYQEIERAIILKPIILQGSGYDYVVSFDQNNSEINEFEKYKLDNLSGFLSKNSNMSTVIINPDEIPMFKERSENVLTYLEEKGVNRSNVYSYDNMPGSQGNIISLKLIEIASDILASSDNKKDDTLAADDKDVILEDITISNLTFNFDKDKTTLYYQDLDRLASYMTKNENAVVEIIGHTDEQGDDIYNVGLSLRRARFVSRYLISKGVNENMLIISGMGESNLIAKDLNPASRKYNRRVEFKVKKQGNNKLKINQIDVPGKYKL
jgi:outer membrane protein OmpA-like peptidoglycan-associated protein